MRSRASIPPASSPARSVGAVGPNPGATLGLSIPNRLLTADEVASILGVPRKTVYSLREQGVLVGRRVGTRLLRFAPADLVEVLDRAKEDLTC